MLNNTLANTGVYGLYYAYMGVLYCIRIFSKSVRNTATVLYSVSVLYYRVCIVYGYTIPHTGSNLEVVRGAQGQGEDLAQRTPRSGDTVLTFSGNTVAHIWSIGCVGKAFRTRQRLSAGSVRSSCEGVRDSKTLESPWPRRAQ
jgi:hypothetical protein